MRPLPRRRAPVAHAATTRKVRPTLRALEQGIAAAHRGVLASILLPWGHLARLDNECISGTSLFNPYSILNRNFSYPSGVAPSSHLPMPADEYLVGVSRDPLHAIIETQLVPNYGAANAGAYAYNAVFRYETVHGTGPVTVQNTAHPVRPVSGSLIDWSSNAGLDYPLAPIFFQANWDQYANKPIYSSRTPWDPCGGYRFPRIANDGLRYFWLSTSEVVTISARTTGGIAPGGLSWALTVREWNNGLMTPPAATEAPTSSNSVWRCTRPGWYNFSYTMFQTTSFGTVHMAISMGIPLPAPYYDALAPPSAESHTVVAIRPIPGLMDRLTIDEHRVVGASVTITPDVPKLVTGVRYAAATLSSKDSFGISQLLAYTDGDTTNGIQARLSSLPAPTAAENSETGEHGAYIWAKPLHADELRMRRVFEHNVRYTGLSSDATPSATTVIAAESANAESWTILVAKFPPNALAGTTVYPGAVFHTSFAFAIEGRSNDPWYGRQRVRNVPSAESLVVTLASAKILHENPLHVADLRRWYNSAVPYIKHVAPSLLALLNKVVPGAEFVGSHVVNLLPEQV